MSTDPRPNRRTPDGNTIYLDKIHCDNVLTTVIKTIDNAHHEIHEGNHFFINNFRDLPNGGSVAFLIQAPANTACHFFYEMKNEVEAEYLFKRDVTFNTAGTTITPENNEQNSSKTASLAWSFNPLTVTGGTASVQSRLGSGRNFGGESRVDREIILKKNSSYYLKVTNRAAGTPNLINWEFYWYEVTE